MVHVPQPPKGGHANHFLDVTNPRSVFVWIVEAREALEDLDTVAADALRPPRRRHLTRAAARTRYRRAHAALAWLLAMPLDAPAAATVTPPPHGSRFEPWAE